jgi:hypothetical protein
MLLKTENHVNASLRVRDALLNDSPMKMQQRHAVANF